MKLVCGKFDPEINPVPFSAWVNDFDAVEIDLFQYFTWKPKVAHYFKEWVKKKNLRIVPRLSIRKQRDPSEYGDALQIWFDCFTEETLYLSITSGRGQWTPELCSAELKKLPKDTPVFFEWGQKDRYENIRFLISSPYFSGWVIDPDWHQAQLPLLKDGGIHYKLHGWNEDRWMRRYGLSLSQKIRRLVERSADASLVLAYSGKMAEAGLFKKGSL